jgi:hypothetical protein
MYSTFSTLHILLSCGVIGALMDQARPAAVITVPDLQNDDCESIQ